MKIYLVGGAVRDKLLGMDSKDKDYVVVGSSRDEMLQAGFEEVGKAFPVFLHPENKCEYALARKEKKNYNSSTNPHCNFDFEVKDVTLEEDLWRRDLTINAIAAETDNSNLDSIIDPYGGVEDLINKVLRHVSDAFIEDPLRVLRVARFAAKLPDFKIAEETLELMKDIVKSEEFKSLSEERVLIEMMKALETEKPSIFFEVLKDIDGLKYFFPELHNLIDVPQNPTYHPEGDCWVHTMLVLDKASEFKDMRITFAALAHDLGKGITPEEILPAHHNHEEEGVPLVEEFCKRLKVPNNLRDCAKIVTRYHLKVHRIKEMTPNSIVKMFYNMDAFRNEHYIPVLARACEADDFGKLKGKVDQGILLEKYFDVVKDVSFKDIRQDLKGEAIGNEIRAERVRRLKKFIGDS